ncbi:MAG: methanogenesis marker 3 protein [Methanomicrobiales archaeon]|nr:methanogenesis marker 3 protein [Methanomicrobiales archaeon]NYT21642.1 methanogenesis marker 3 protein [Methanomicrobiales archaeon]
MTTITIHLDGEELEIEGEQRLGAIIPDRDPRCSVAVIRPVSRESTRTSSYRITTTRGEITVEPAGDEEPVFNSPVFSRQYPIHWHDRYAAAFGPFSSDIRPARVAHLYERGDVILGCGGYDPKRSYLIFSKMRHSADFGAGKNGGIIGRVVSGMGVLDRWTTGDTITRIEQVISWADTSRSFTTTERDIILEDGMEIVTRAVITAQGFSPDGIDTTTAKSVEHLLLTLREGLFTVSRSGSTHIVDLSRSETDVPEEIYLPRREGVVTVRTRGKSRGGIYLYIEDIPASPAHTVVGQITRGIELARLAREGDFLCVTVQPERFDLLGKTLPRAQEIAGEREITLTIDTPGEERVVVDQVPSTTLECLQTRRVELTTVPFGKVIDISLDDEHAPASCEIFRKLTGLHQHRIGRLPFFFHFEDVYLFKPSIPKGVTIIPENTPHDTVPAMTLAITNDSRKGSGLVGVRTTDNSEFGPTSEPFDGTNIIGRILEPEKLKDYQEKETVFIREAGK